MRIVFLLLLSVLFLFSPLGAITQPASAQESSGEAEEEGQESEEDSFLNLPETKFLEREEFTQRSLPYSQQSNPGFFDKVFGGILGKTSNFRCVFTPSCNRAEEENITERAMGAIDRTAGEKGFGQSFTPAYKQEESSGESFLDKINIFKKKVDHIQKSVLPARLSAEDSTSSQRTRFPSSAIDMQSGGMLDWATTVAGRQCVPVNLILSFIKREASFAFSWSDVDFREFSRDGWWIGADLTKLTTGYCYNTCDDPSVGCAVGSDVKGVAQFEIGTWNSILPQVKATLVDMQQIPIDSADFYIPNRCNARDAIIGQAILLKQLSGTAPNQCTAWNSSIVRGVAGRYCGADCIDVAACGTNYCEEIDGRYEALGR